MTGGDFDDQQFDVQLELEEVTPEQLQERASGLRRALETSGAPPEVRMTFSLRIWVALMRSPVLSNERREALFTAWCEGLAVPERDVWDEMERILRNARK